MALSDLALGVVIALVTLFVGLYAISLTAAVLPDNIMKDYVYTTATNSSESVINTSSLGKHTYNVSNLEVVSGKASSNLMAFAIENANTTNITVTVYFNGNLLGNMTAVNQTNTTSATYNVKSYITTGFNNLTLNATANGALMNVTSSVLYYPSSSQDSNWGSINTNLTENTSTIFDVLVLVIIITALGIGIAVLKGFAGGTEAGTSPAI